MRALWSGFISFGLINIPIRLYSGTEDHSLHFGLFHAKDSAPIRYAKICTREEKEVPWEEVVKGYDRGDGEYVMLSAEDFEAAKVEHEKTVDILQFIDIAEISPLFYDKPFFLEPGKGGNKPYCLLVEALKKAGKVGICRYFLHTMEHYAAMIPMEDVLVLNQIRLLEDIRDYSSLNIPKIKVQKGEIDLAVQLIDHLSGHFAPETYRDTYKEHLQAIVTEKAKGKKVKVTKRKEVASTKIVDLMGALKKSLESQKPRPRRKSA